MKAIKKHGTTLQICSMGIDFSSFNFSINGNISIINENWIN